VNVLTADFACADGKVSRFTLRQSASNPDYPTLRSQLVQVGALRPAGRQARAEREGAGHLHRRRRRRCPPLVGKACPALVYPNYEDWGFAKVALDDKSFATARGSLSKTDDVMLRSMLWQSLSDGLREQRVSLLDNIDALLVNAPLETDPGAHAPGARIDHQRRGTLRISSANGASPKAKKYARLRRPQARGHGVGGLVAHRGKRDQARSWFDTYVEVATARPALRACARSSTARKRPTASRSTRTFAGTSSRSSTATTPRAARR
jgi:aminopeptidase N